MKLYVGLGNPGKKFKLTRHNLGFMVLDKFIQQSSVKGWDKKFDSFFNKIIIDQRSIILIKPLRSIVNIAEILPALRVCQYPKSITKCLIPEI